MKKQFQIEYELKSASINSLWKAIGTALGLAEWFAEGVTVNENQYTFIWNDYEQTANLIELKTNSHIKFRWNEDDETDRFFEMRLQTSQISGNLTLIITDFSEENEYEDQKLLWNNQVDILKRKRGL